MLGPPAKDKRYSYVVCQVGRALERDRLKTLVFDFWSTVVAVVSNPAPDIVEFDRLKSSLKGRNFAGTKWLVLQNIISSDGSSCQHRIFPEMSSQNSYSDITTRVAITSYKIAKNVWFYVSQFKYANTIETLGTFARSGTPNPL